MTMPPGRGTGRGNFTTPPNDALSANSQAIARQFFTARSSMRTSSESRSGVKAMRSPMLSRSNPENWGSPGVTSGTVPPRQIANQRGHTREPIFASSNNVFTYLDRLESSLARLTGRLDGQDRLLKELRDRLEALDGLPPEAA